MKNFYTEVIQWSWSWVGPLGRAVPQAQLIFVWGQPQHRLRCFRRKRVRIWCTEDEAPVEGMGLSGWPAHAQECDMKSRGSLNWEALSQAGIVRVDGRNWQHRALARELYVCPESTRRCWGRQWLKCATKWKSECVCDQGLWIVYLDYGLCTGRWGRVTTTCQAATRLLVDLLLCREPFTTL